LEFILYEGAKKETKPIKHRAKNTMDIIDLTVSGFTLNLNLNFFLLPRDIVLMITQKRHILKRWL